MSWPPYPQGKNPWYPLDGRLGVGPKALLKAVEERNIPRPHRESKPRTPTVQPVTIPSDPPRVNIKVCLKERWFEVWDWTQVALGRNQRGCMTRAMNPRVPLKAGIPDQLIDYQLLKKDSASWG